jgi:hypothetical protein
VVVEIVSARLPDPLDDVLGTEFLDVIGSAPRPYSDWA